MRRSAMRWLSIGAANAALAIALGAFAAHGLKSRLAPAQLAVFETGARYHLLHAVAIVMGSLIAAAALLPWARMRWVLGLWALGLMLFSGSLYVLTLSGVRMLGAITPFGGVSFMAGWLLLAYTAWRARVN